MLSSGGVSGNSVVGGAITGVGASTSSRAYLCRQAGAVLVAGLLDRCRQILKQVPAIGHLGRVRCCRLNRAAVAAVAVPAGCAVSQAARVSLVRSARRSTGADLSTSTRMVP
jgi:hypothetical protein